MPPTGDPDDRDDEPEDDGTTFRTYRISDSDETGERSETPNPSNPSEPSKPSKPDELETENDPDRTPKGGDTVAVLPYLGVLTFDEIHAAYLGTCGVLVGLAYANGTVEEAVGFTLAIVGVAFGVRVMPRDMDVPGAAQYRKNPNPAVTVLTFVPFLLKTAAARTVRKEPWYFVVTYLVAFLAGVGLDYLLTGTG